VVIRSSERGFKRGRLDDRLRWSDFIVSKRCLSETGLNRCCGVYTGKLTLVSSELSTRFKISKFCFMFSTKDANWLDN
jgi:hypothetical protein